jgi:hypothetical protein
VTFSLWPVVRSKVGPTSWSTVQIAREAKIFSSADVAPVVKASSEIALKISNRLIVGSPDADLARYGITPALHSAKLPQSRGDAEEGEMVAIGT